jgi:hypothetical protein
MAGTGWSNTRRLCIDPQLSGKDDGPAALLHLAPLNEVS